jgi:hypothetical protein
MWRATGADGARLQGMVLGKTYKAVGSGEYLAPTEGGLRFALCALRLSSTRRSQHGVVQSGWMVAG